ncbi:MAG TPA: hypothetical protein VGS96_04030 [Thermoanaerobaculia bacterium]|jgi:hypothetical protein|nr:hypothetical protein [Thermoanaerobaculia bacterium]
MNTKKYEALLRKAVIRAVDSISKKATETEKAAEGAVARLLKRWHKMDQAQKETIAGLVIATATAAVGAFAAIKSRAKKAKKTVKKTGRKSAKAAKKMM